LSSQLILKRASASRPSGEWSEDDFDVLKDGAVVGRIFKVNAAPVGSPWMWTLAFGHHEIAAPPMAMQRAARTLWPPSPRAGGGYDTAANTPQTVIRGNPTGGAN